MQQLSVPECVAKPDPVVPSLASGSLDVAIASQYRASFLVGNTSFASSARSVAADSGKIFQARTATVRFLQAGAEVATFTPIATGTIDPGGRDPGYGIVNVEVVPASLGSKLHAAIDDVQHPRFEVHVSIHGVTLDGGAIDTPEYVFDLDVCRGCSVYFPDEAWDRTVGVPGHRNCLEPLTSMSVGLGTACLPGQDGTTDCRACQYAPECTPCVTNADCSGTTCLPSHHCG